MRAAFETDLHVDLRNRQSALKQRAFGENFPILDDEIVTGKDEVGRALPFARIRIYVAADGFGRLRLDEQPPVIRFPRRFAAGGKIDDDMCACKRVRNRWRRGNPQIFADLGGNGKILLVDGTKHHPRAEGHGLTFPLYGAHRAVEGNKHCGVRKTPRNSEDTSLERAQAACPT
ncbi:MAG: hypothetical protein ACLRTQ_12125 [Candidatus Borkfalkia sp.]